MWRFDGAESLGKNERDVREQGCDMRLTFGRDSDKHFRCAAARAPSLPASTVHFFWCFHWGRGRGEGESRPFAPLRSLQNAAACKTRTQTLEKTVGPGPSPHPLPGGTRLPMEAAGRGEGARALQRGGRKFSTALDERALKIAAVGVPLTLSPSPMDYRLSMDGRIWGEGTWLA